MTHRRFCQNFSEDGTKLFFGTAPRPLEKDTSLLDEEIVNLEVWSYNDSRLHTQQKVEKDRDLKKAYTAVLNIGNKSVAQLGQLNMGQVRLGNEGNASNALGSNDKPYQITSSWEGRSYNDLFAIDISTGTVKKIAEKIINTTNKDSFSSQLVAENA